MQLGVFIAGRLGSERLPNKLILPLGESNLWDMACKKLNDLPERFNKYALCYEDELVWIADKYPNIKVIIRDKETAEVDGPLKYIFKDLKDTPDTHLMFLNPCLSFLKGSTIEESLVEFETKHKEVGIDYATSVKPYQNWLFDGTEKCITPIDYTTLSTKTIPMHYETAHCFHIFNKDYFFEDGYMLKDGHGLIAVSKEETIDVDTPMDYEFAKWKHSKRYVIDIDGTICTHESNYANAQPLHHRIAHFNRLYEAGNEIIYQTARGYVTGIDWRAITEAQLKKWGVKYHQLMFGKPNADYYIDDKAINVEDIDA